MIYQKTTAGIAEISATQKTLTFRLRQVLIMVDGKRDIDSLAQLLRQPNLQETFAELLRLGYIHDVATPVPVAAKNSLPAIEVVAQHVRYPLNKIQIDTIKAILTASTEQYLGIMGRSLKQKIEAASDENQITLCASQWHMAMRESKSGRDMAGTLMHQVQTMLDATGE